VRAEKHQENATPKARKTEEVEKMVAEFTVTDPNLIDIPDEIWEPIEVTIDSLDRITHALEGCLDYSLKVSIDASVESEDEAMERGREGERETKWRLQFKVKLERGLQVRWLSIKITVRGEEIFLDGLTRNVRAKDRDELRSLIEQELEEHLRRWAEDARSQAAELKELSRIFSR